MSSAAPGLLAELARTYGVATEYWDWQGQHQIVQPETIEAVLTALGVDASTDDSAARALTAAADRAWRRLVAPFTLVRTSATSSGGAQLKVHVPHGSPVTVWVELEDGSRRDLSQMDVWVEPRWIDGAQVGEATFALPADLPLGWHTVHAQIPSSTGEAGDGGAAGADAAREREASGALVVVPDALTLPAEIDARGAFGLMSQVYSVRSRHSWGIGDLSDVADMASWSARQLGADFVLVNPLHAAGPTLPMEPSPYLPTSRRFVNPIYLRVEDIPEVAYVDGATRSAIERIAVTARAQNTSERIDRDAAWTAKLEALAMIHAAPRSSRREAAFTAYKEREGQGLIDYATWCALCEKFGEEESGWPEGYEGPNAAKLPEARRELAERIDFHAWLQWVVDEQLADLQRECRTSGMAMGMMQDLAVGVHPAGADAWGLGSALASGVTVGAPPDPYNQLGQDWSQPPWRPDQLEELGYAPFRDMIRTVLRHAGGLRIDHVIGLFRLWWVPQGLGPRSGTYVRYDHEAMIGILVLEAHRAGAVIVGEDLGTVEPWVREYLRDRGILGTSILWFERHDDGTPRRPEEYRRLCLASVTTHDLPPTNGYLQGEHMRIREELGLFTRDVAIEEAEDKAERESMIAALRERGIVGEHPTQAEIVEGLHEYLSWSPALLLGVAVPDLVGDVRAMNQPGTDKEYPNWQLPLSGPDRTPLLLEDLMAAPVAQRLTRRTHRGRRA